MPTTIWNVADKDSEIGLSGGDLTASHTGSTGGRGVRATTSHSRGKWYFEMRLNWTLNFDDYMGVLAGDKILSPYSVELGDNPPPGSWLFGLPGGGGVAHDAGTYGFKVDLDTGTIELAHESNFSSWTVQTGLPLGELFPWIQVYVGPGSGGTAESVTANFGATAFLIGDVPADCRSWDGSQVGTSAGDIASGDIAVVAMGDGGTVNDSSMSTLDGLSWTTGTLPTFNNGAAIQYSALCYSPDLSLFVAIAPDAPDVARSIVTSPDGHTWTQRTAPELNQWTSVCWSKELSLFVAVAQTGAHRVMTSPDGFTWTVRTAAAALQWQSVCWSSALGLFVAVAKSGTGNRVMTSSDGINWSSQTSGYDSSWNSVVWAGALNLFVAVANSAGGSNDYMTSHDGMAWTAYSSPSAHSWVGLVWSPELGMLMAISNTGCGGVMTSTDGYTWATQTDPSGLCITWAGGCWSSAAHAFYLVANQVVYYSRDGETWNEGTPAASYNWARIVAGSSDVGGPLAATEGADNFAAVARVDIVGSIAATETADTPAAAGFLPGTGTWDSGEVTDRFRAFGAIDGGIPPSPTPRRVVFLS